MNRKIISVLLCLLMAFTCGSLASKVLAAPVGPISVNWISVNNCGVELSINGAKAECMVKVKPRPSVKKISGNLRLDYVDVNGTIKNIASWKIDSTGTVGSRYFANIPDYGMYQLSFSGTTYMADGSTESISASTTKIK